MWVWNGFAEKNIQRNLRLQSILDPVAFTQKYWSKSCLFFPVELQTYPNLWNEF